MLRCHKHIVQAAGKVVGACCEGRLPVARRGWATVVDPCVTTETSAAEFANSILSESMRVGPSGGRVSVSGRECSIFHICAVMSVNIIIPLNSCDFQSCLDLRHNLDSRNQLSKRWQEMQSHSGSTPLGLTTRTHLPCASPTLGSEYDKQAAWFIKM